MAPQAQVTNLMHKAQPSRYKAKATAQSTGKLKTAKGREAAKHEAGVAVVMAPQFNGAER